MAITATFSPQQELSILCELARLGYVREGSPLQAEARGYWAFAPDTPQPCIMACPSLSHIEDADEAGYVMLMIFPDNDLILHCGFTGRIDYLDPDQGIEAAVLEAERFASALA